jgi:hydroxymethylglutaryl-CoA reductase (NADPH)
VPMATTEGALVASTNRGARAISMAGGTRTVVTSNGMTRAPLLRMPSLESAAALKEWVDRRENQDLLAEAFASTSRFGRLQSVVVATAGRNVYLRFKCSTGDAMGMNMITKGVNAALAEVVSRFEGARVLSLSGNMCTDKKPSAINWIEGRGKSVTAEVRLSRKIIEDTLKTTAARLVELNTGKNLIGSALAGSIGGFNAHAANIVSAVFLATGQDVAQNVESSTCMTIIEHDDDETNPGGVIATVSMPSIEVGTVGGGTSLSSQAACLELLGFRGAAQVPGANAEGLARVVASSVLAGELSLMAAHTTGDLLRAHMALNRKPATGGASVSGAGASSSASSASASVQAKRGPSHNISTVQGGAGALRHAEAAVPTVGRRFFGASLDRSVRPACPARDAPACFSRASTDGPSPLDEDFDAPFLPVP